MSTVKKKCAACWMLFPMMPAGKKYSIYVRERVERGRREVAQGKVIDEAEFDRRFKRWTDE